MSPRVFLASIALATTILLPGCDALSPSNAGISQTATPDGRVAPPGSPALGFSLDADAAAADILFERVTVGEGRALRATLVPVPDSRSRAVAIAASPSPYGHPASYEISFDRKGNRGAVGPASGGSSSAAQLLVRPVSDDGTHGEVIAIWEGLEEQAPTLMTARAPDSVHYTVEDGTVVVWVDYHRGGVVATGDGLVLYVDLVGYRVEGGKRWDRFELSGARIEVASVSSGHQAEAAHFVRPVEPALSLAEAPLRRRKAKAHRGQG